jgi:hypothetical protein
MWFGRRGPVLPAAKLIFENFGCGHAAIDLVSIQRVCWDDRERLKRDRLRCSRDRALVYCLRMILSENRYPSRSKCGAGFFRIML